ncbi:MAG: hypothetical protein P8Z41_15590 [Anaerolineales bacterium]
MASGPVSGRAIPTTIFSLDREEIFPQLAASSPAPVTAAVLIKPRRDIACLSTVSLADFSEPEMLPFFAPILHSFTIVRDGILFKVLCTFLPLVTTSCKRRILDGQVERCEQQPNTYLSFPCGQARLIPGLDDPRGHLQFYRLQLYMFAWKDRRQSGFHSIPAGEIGPEKHSAQESGVTPSA